VDADRTHADVRTITTGTADADGDRNPSPALRVAGGRRGVAGFVAAGIAQSGVGVHHLGEQCRVGGFRTGVRVEGEQKSPVGRADLGRSGIARDAEYAVRVR
jgi:hypothetical protein